MVTSRTIIRRPAPCSSSSHRSAAYDSCSPWFYGVSDDFDAVARAVPPKADDLHDVMAIIAPQQGTDGAGLSGGGVGLSQHAQFVFGGEGSSLGVGDHLRVRSWRARRQAPNLHRRIQTAHAG